VKPVIIAVVAQAVYSLGRTALKHGGLAFLALAATAAAALGAHELLVVFGAGLAAAAPVIARQPRRRGPPAAALYAVLPGSLGLAAASAPAVGLWSIFLVFLKIGSVMFGSGYVLLAFLRADLVERTGWLSEAQILDAVAAGQLTPGPVSTSATFVGYLLGGAPAAVLATLGIFLPAFVFVALSGPLVARMRKSAVAAALVDGVNVGSLAVMALVSWQLGRSTIVDPLTAAIAGVALLLLIWIRLNPAWLVLAAAATTTILHLLRT
jgi:chromate transporter